MITTPDLAIDKIVQFPPEYKLGLAGLIVRIGGISSCPVLFFHFDRILIIKMIPECEIPPVFVRVLGILEIIDLILIAEDGRKLFRKIIGQKGTCLIDYVSFPVCFTLNKYIVSTRLPGLLKSVGETQPEPLKKCGLRQKIQLMPDKIILRGIDPVALVAVVVKRRRISKEE